MASSKESNFWNARRFRTQVVSSFYHVPNGIDIVLCNTIGNNVDIYLPSSFSFFDAPELTIKKITDDVHRVRIYPSNGELIEGQSYLNLPNYNDSVVIKAQAGFWIIKADTIFKQSSSGINPETDSIMLTSTELSSKQVILSHLPNYDRLIKVFSGGLRHTVGIDYRMNGNILSWDGLGLETVLSEYDRLDIDYFY